jgi:hypothetical protein
LRKGWFRTVGTVVGAVAIAVLTACFLQDRIGFSSRLGTLRCCGVLQMTVRKPFVPIISVTVDGDRALRTGETYFQKSERAYLKYIPTSSLFDTAR